MQPYSPFHFPNNIQPSAKDPSGFNMHPERSSSNRRVRSLSEGDSPFYDGFFNERVLSLSDFNPLEIANPLKKRKASVLTTNPIQETLYRTKLQKISIDD